MSLRAHNDGWFSVTARLPKNRRTSTETTLSYLLVSHISHRANLDLALLSHHSQTGLCDPSSRLTKLCLPLQPNTHPLAIPQRSESSFSVFTNFGGAGLTS